MKKNPIYESLIDKSIGSMLSAIEIYNKPDFKYREETFAILAINSWELLLKARLLKLNSYRINSIYCYKPYINKNGEKSKKKKEPKTKVTPKKESSAPAVITPLEFNFDEPAPAPKTVSADEQLKLDALMAELGI